MRVLSPCAADAGSWLVKVAKLYERRRGGNSIRCLLRQSYRHFGSVRHNDPGERFTRRVRDTICAPNNRDVTRHGQHILLRDSQISCTSSRRVSDQCCDILRPKQWVVKTSLLVFSRRNHRHQVKHCPSRCRIIFAARGEGT